jgi:hypothetical protein
MADHTDRPDVSRSWSRLGMFRKTQDEIGSVIEPGVARRD